MIWLLFGGLGALVVWLAFRSQRKRGQAEQAAKHNEKVVEDVEKANEAVRRLADPAERKRVRSKFSRK